MLQMCRYKNATSLGLGCMYRIEFRFTLLFHCHICWIISDIWHVRKQRRLQSNSWCWNSSSSSKIDSKIRLLTLSDSWLNSAGLFITGRTVSGEGFRKWKALFWYTAWQFVFISVLNTECRFSDTRGRQVDPDSQEIVYFYDEVVANAVNSSAIRCQLSPMEAATCSRASYRVKTTDSLDYRDSVCVFTKLFIFVSIRSHFFCV